MTFSLRDEAGQSNEYETQDITPGLSPLCLPVAFLHSNHNLKKKRGGEGGGGREGRGLTVRLAW